MNRVPVFVGLDYHQASVQVCVMGPDRTMLANRRCANDALEIIQTVERHGRVLGAAIESCAGAADLAEELIGKANWSVDLAHPGFVARMKQNPDKSDFTDAQLLADLERVGYLPKVWLAPHEVRELRRLVRYRQQRVNERRDTKLRIRASLREQRVRPVNLSPWTQAWLAWLTTTEELSEQSRWIIAQHLRRLQGLRQEIDAVETRLAHLTATDPLVTALCGHKGIGAVTAWTMRAEIGRFDRFRTGKQLARFCGLSPRNASSGHRQADAGLIKAGNRHLRATLIEAAQRLIRFDRRWSDYAVEMLQRGKPKCVVIAAVANRWVRWLFHQLQPSKLAA
jgi:transposase